MIKFNDLGYFAKGKEIDEDTGFLKDSAFTPTPCRIQHGFKNIVNIEGNQVVSEIQIYLAPQSIPDINWKFKFNAKDSREYKIQSIEFKKDVNGKVRYVLVYI